MSAIQKQKTVLGEVQLACTQLGLLPAPTDVFGSQDDTATLMGSLANLAGTLLNDKYEWQDLQKTLTITGDGTTTEFDLPTDFSRIINNTGWSTVIRRPVAVLNAQQWAMISTWLSQSFFVNPACRIYQSKLQFLAPPPVGTILFQYQVCDWVIDGDDPNVTKSELAKNSDSPRFDWLIMVLAIKVKWLEQKGMDTTAAQSDLEDRYFQLTGKDGLSPTVYLNGGVVGGLRFLDGYNVPDTGIGL